MQRDSETDYTPLYSSSVRRMLRLPHTPHQYNTTTITPIVATTITTIKNTRQNITRTFTKLQ
jgi:hypothetical protein